LIFRAICWAEQPALAPCYVLLPAETLAFLFLSGF
jgi:hypothetical protein